MTSFSLTHQGTLVTKRDAMHAFFTQLFSNDRVCPDRGAARNLMADLLEGITQNANVHNQNIDFHGYKVMDFNFDHQDWTEVVYDFELGEHNPHRIYHIVTKHQYFLIGSQGAIEVHQIVDDKYMKIDHDLYRENQCKSLILLKPGADGKDVWGVPNTAKEFFSENTKSGIISSRIEDNLKL